MEPSAARCVQRLAVLACVLAAVPALAQTPQGTAFTYQGRLTDAGAPATGSFDFQLRLYDAPTAGSQVGSTLSLPAVPVASGLFTVSLDFGSGAFGPNARWLEIAVRPGASTGAYTFLAPRQQITNSPFSIKSVNATSADSLSGSCVLCITDAQIQSVEAGKITGIVPIANGGTGSSTKDFVDLSTNQAVGGNKTFNNATTLNGAVTVAGSNNTLTVDGSLNVGFEVTADQFFGGGDGLFNIPASGLSGVVSIANGGTGSSTQNFVDLAANQIIGGNKSFAGTVGVGSVNLDAKLIVSSSTTSAGNNTAYFEAPAIGPNASNIHYGTNGDWYIRSAAAAGKVVLQDTGGNVGIGTPMPTEKLDVAGNIKSTGTISGDASGLTNLNGSNITSGTIAAGRLGLAGMGFSGRVSGLPSTGGILHGGASGFTDVQANEGFLTTLSPNRPCLAMNLSVLLVNGVGGATPPGTGNSRLITLRARGFNTTVSCIMTDSATTCDSGTLDSYIAPGSWLVIRINSSDGGTPNDIGGSAIVFGWECR